ncbi:MAG: AAA family ATPase [Bacteroidota bacterium]|nr:AAA family ATPase [Bacteroidota bacterium]
MAYLKPGTHKELTYQELRWKCNPSTFEFDSTEDILPLEGILGQERAIKALKLGVDLKGPGYNIFIAGLSGTGKATTVKKMLEDISSDPAPLNDYVYVSNFKDADSPILLTFNSGEANKFKKDISETVKLLKKRIPQALDGKAFISKEADIVTQYNEKEQKLIDNYEERIRQDNFALGQIKEGETEKPDILPIIENKPVPIDQIDQFIQSGQLSKNAAQDIIKKYNTYVQELQGIFKKGLKLNQEYQEKIGKLERESVEIVINSSIDCLLDTYTDKKVRTHILNLQKDILENIDIFKGQKPTADIPEGYVIDYFRDYEVNIILSNKDTKGSPVVIETFPTFVNLFGAIDKESDGHGGWYSDFTNIKAGSLLRANGGFLVLNVNHLFEEPGVWKTLKRVLTYRLLEIQDPHSYFQVAPSNLKPEPIPITTKIILLGSQNTYSYLSNYEYDFKKIFKIKADFDYEITMDEDVLIKYARVIKKMIKEEDLLDFDKSAIAYLIELSARFAGQKNKLTTRFSMIADLAREATFWAKAGKYKIVKAKHIREAYEAAKERHGMLETKVTEMFENKTFLIDTEGERIGQINGLAVYEADFYSFGRPTRITATVSLGSGSIINVEREAGMSGRHYNKGVLIISGYFKEMFGQDLPLSFNANLVFEQSYGTVDGDSASCAEIFALISTLADLPIKQSIAVTGSLNQKGDVQPIGGVNEKIEGFYDICKIKGFNNKQGVIIPIQNVKDLMLREDVIQSVKKKQFHIYAIEKVEEGLEILMGVAAGDPLVRPFKENTIYDLVERKIKDLYAKARAIKSSSKEPKTRKKVRP